MPNPIVAQGTLNRLLGSVTIPNFPSLNVTAPYLSKEGIRITFQGETTLYLNSMTGAVTSPEPYMLGEITINLLKTQSLGTLYKSQMEFASLIGNVTVRSDSASLGIYQFVNCSIKSVRELDFAGTTAVFPVVLGGYYLLNSSLYQ